MDALSGVSKPEWVRKNQFANSFRSRVFYVQMNKDAQQELKTFLEHKNNVSDLRCMNDLISFTVRRTERSKIVINFKAPGNVEPPFYEGGSRSMVSTGSLIGGKRATYNKKTMPKVYTGSIFHKYTEDLNITVEDLNSDEDSEAEPSRRKKNKKPSANKGRFKAKDILTQMIKIDANAPPREQMIPLPPVPPSYKKDVVELMREKMKRTEIWKKSNLQTKTPEIFQKPPKTVLEFSFST